jgi:hypothetical protein
MILARIGGVPVEELLSLAPVAAAFLFALRAPRRGLYARRSTRGG